jgi:DNA-binding transcriptional regulator YiaG
MNTNTEVKMRPFDIHIPNLEGDGVTEIIRIDIPVRIDPQNGQEILTTEAHDLIEKTKARRMGLMSADEIRELRGRLDLTQEEMSDLLQIGAKTYTRWESGRARVSRSMNVLLCALRDGRIDVNYLRGLRDPLAVTDWPAKDWSRMILPGCHVPVPPMEFQTRVTEAFTAWLKRADVFEERSMPLLTLRPDARELSALHRRSGNRGVWLVESQQEFPRAISTKLEVCYYCQPHFNELLEEQQECEETQTNPVS